ncbi:hypothetical protein [Stutzerimonas stutzeri]|jgi:hypothetical protein|nr:hypothetical protein [Stutzerimonas stutzeri]EQM79709.1 hypothetical protein L686_10880 [Stutzerimonas stutzeri MF28]
MPVVELPFARQASRPGIALLFASHCLIAISLAEPQRFASSYL